MRFQIVNTLTGNVEVDIDESFKSQPESLKLGEAVKVAYKIGADIRGTDLCGVNLCFFNLYGANLHNVNLRDANLRGVIMHNVDLRNASLYGASLHNVDLRGADLRGADLRYADLRGTNLSGANLSGAKFTVIEAGIVVPSLHRKIIQAIDAGGKLDMREWHVCETTHCRAGWAVHLAGAVGRVLEACIGPAAAGALIHLASCPQLDGKIPDFHASDADAMADIRRLAELEPAISE